MALFSVADGTVVQLLPQAFATFHTEERIQKWADRAPALLNEGQPMLSLGIEIPTKHGLYLDNLFIDGNGTLVGAEMKRGRSPRDVVAQALDYAAYISVLDWPQVESLCRRRQGKDLESAYTELFRYGVDRSAKPKHRLLIVAESFDARVLDSALYLINGGLQLALLRFAYLPFGEQAVLDMETVLGEIPKQGISTTSGLAPSTGATEPTAVDGYSRWLMGSIAQALPDIAKNQGWPLRYRLNKTSVVLGSDAWPLSLGDCQLRADTFRNTTVSLRLAFRKEAAPALQDYLEVNKAEWEAGFAARFESPPYPSQFATLSIELPRPTLGDPDELGAVVEAVEAMTRSLVPAVSRYFDRAVSGHSK